MIPVRTLNIARNLGLCSRFLVKKFQTFIVRYKNRSYVLEQSDPTDLIKIINSGVWINMDPIRPQLDVNSILSKVLGRINQIMFNILDWYQTLLNYVPNYIISIAVMCVIIFFVYSIFDVLMYPNEKIKVD